jgi:hypothetical protein
LPVPKDNAVHELSVSTEVKAPSGFAVAFLNTYVRDIAGESGEGTIPLRYTIQHLAGLTLERDVNVRVEYLPDPAGGPAELNVAWEPDMSIFPSFCGKLVTQPTGETSCTLTIDGNYDAPGGVAGQLFDAVVGVRIARGTIEELLEQFRVATETDYQRRTEYS